MCAIHGEIRKPFNPELRPKTYEPTFSRSQVLSFRFVFINDRHAIQSGLGCG